jgi:hypothetical protein
VVAFTTEGTPLFQLRPFHNFWSYLRKPGDFGCLQPVPGVRGRDGTRHTSFSSGRLRARRDLLQERGRLALRPGLSEGPFTTTSRCARSAGVWMRFGRRMPRARLLPLRCGHEVMWRLQTIKGVRIRFGVSTLTLQWNRVWSVRERSFKSGYLHVRRRHTLRTDPGILERGALLHDGSGRAKMHRMLHERRLRRRPVRHGQRQMLIASNLHGNLAVSSLRAGGMQKGRELLRTRALPGCRPVCRMHVAALRDMHGKHRLL